MNISLKILQLRNALEVLESRTESTFDGFDAIDVKLMFKLDWFKI